MKHIISIFFIPFFLLTSLSLFAGKLNENQLITELKVFDNDTTFRYLYLYDNAGNKVLETKYFKQDNVWARISQTEWVYKSGNCINQTERIWKNDGWLNTYTIENNYIDNLLDKEIHSTFKDKIPQQFKKLVYQYNASKLANKEVFSYKSDNWNLQLHTDYFYSQSTQPDSILTAVYQADTICSRYLFKNVYSTDGMLISQLQQEKGNDNVWVNTQLVNWFYRAGSNQVLLERVKKWNKDATLWENKQRIDYEYNDANKLTSETYQYWKVMFWENDLRYDYRYDSNGNETKKIMSKTIYNQWRGLISINYSNFSGDKANLMESKYEFWGGNTGELVTSYIPFSFNNEIAIQKAKSLQISYSVNDTVEAVPVVRNLNRTIPVYPNPSYGVYYINTHDYGIESWVITNPEGRELKNHVQSVSSGVIDITDLPKGIYILKVTTKTSLLTQKLIKK